MNGLTNTKISPATFTGYGGFFYTPKHDVTPRVVAIAVRIAAKV